MQQAKGYADCERFEVKYVFSTNGHRYGEFDCFTGLQGGPFPFPDFPHHADLTARYARDSGIDLGKPEAAMLFQADSPAWSHSRYYQDAASYVAYWHIADVQRLTDLGPLTGALPTFGAECRFIGAFQTFRQAVLKVAV